MYHVIHDQPGESKKKELILDQGRVRYLKEKCGWHNVVDEHFKSLKPSTSSVTLSYFDDKGKICFKAFDIL